MLFEVCVSDLRKSEATMCLDHHLCSVSTEEAMNSVTVEVKPLIQTYKELFRGKSHQDYHLNELLTTKSG